MVKHEEHVDKLFAMRHSAAHVLAQAVLEMFPDAKLGVGPVIEHGFYYDFLLPRTLIPEDLDILQEKMERIVKENQKFVRQEAEGEKVLEFLKAAEQQFKVELAEGFIAEGLDLTLYENIDDEGDVKFVDLCRGGHTESTKGIGAFKLHKIAGAYWKGDEKRDQLQRIYGFLFETPKELRSHLRMIEEAKKRDHRKVGKALDLFTFSDLVGSGLPLFTPRGTMLRELLNDFSQELRLKRGFQKVWSPHITKTVLYETSGHWDKFGDELFLVESQETSDKMVMKPMNCPHHQQIYNARPRSYKEFPIKFMETTTVYRDEKSGEMLGLSRVRSITQDDSHVFCTPDQIEEVYQMFIDIVSEFYETLGMKFKARLSFRDPETPEKYLGKPELWDKAQKIILDIAKKSNLDYFEAEGEAAFYGPKIDFMVFDALGRQWQLATPQLDFVQPARFGLTYTDSDGKDKTPVMIHFALMGSIERFLSVYIEHTVGAFPTWVAPLQVMVLPVSDKFLDYAKEVEERLLGKGIRVQIDATAESLGKKIRGAEKMKVPWMLVIGEKEVADKNVAARNYHTKEQNVISLDDFVKSIVEEVSERRLPKSKL